MQTNIVPKLIATLWLSESRCVIGINATPVPLKFSWLGRKLFASDGRQVIFPADDSEAYEALVDGLISRLQKDPASVFVCEFGPTVPIKEHPIHIVGW